MREEKVDLGQGMKEPEKRVLKWLNLAWKSASKSEFELRDMFFIAIIIMVAVDIVVSYVRV